MRVSICVGNYASVPYCVPGVGIRVYCMEELCFVLAENAFLLDGSAAGRELADWIDRECGLKELSRALYSMLHRQTTLSAYVALILDFVGLYDEKAVAEVRQALKQGAGLSGMEKRKNRADYLVQKKKYAAAVKSYEGLIEQWRENAEGTEAPAADQLAVLWHNKGVAQTGLMLYEAAAECFLKAYELAGRRDFCRAYLAAKRMALTDREYVDFTAGNQVGYELTLELEKDMERLTDEWRRQPEYLRLCGRMEAGCRVERDRLIRTLKDSYRGSAAD